MLKKYPQDLVVHCSKRNHSTQTFKGVDVMGERLAEEVRSVIKPYRSLQKISFVGHSLGGLVARYAIARLYEQEPEKVGYQRTNLGFIVQNFWMLLSIYIIWD